MNLTVRHEVRLLISARRRAGNVPCIRPAKPRPPQPYHALLIELPLAVVEFLLLLQHRRVLSLQPRR